MKRTQQSEHPVGCTFCHTSSVIRKTLGHRGDQGLMCLKAFILIIVSRRKHLRLTKPHDGLLQLTCTFLCYQVLAHNTLTSIKADFTLRHLHADISQSLNPTILLPVCHYALCSTVCRVDRYMHLILKLFRRLSRLIPMHCVSSTSNVPIIHIGFLYMTEGLGTEGRAL